MCWGGLVLGLLMGQANRASAADESNPPAEVGLRGILPSGTPAGLSDALSAAPQGWTEWFDQLRGEVDQLYGADPLDLNQQRQLLDRLQSRINTLQEGIRAPRNATVLPPLMELLGQLSRRVQIARALFDTLNMPSTARQTRLETTRAKTGQATEVFESYLTSRRAVGWLRHLEVVRVGGAVAEKNDPVAVRFATVATTRMIRKRQEDEGMQRLLDRPHFRSYEDSLHAYVAAYEHLAVAPDAPNVRGTMADLVAALEDYEDKHDNQSATAVRRAAAGVDRTAADGGRGLSEAIRRNYLNWNMYAILSDTLFNKFVGRQQGESGPVDDCILGAKVDGTQVTYTSVRFNFVPSLGPARFDLTLSGVTNSSTQGVTSQATVYTQGTHYFNVYQSVAFDGDRFYIEAPRVCIKANNNTYAAETCLSGIPFVGGFARKVALNKAEQMRPQSEAIAAGRLQDRLLPRLNEETAREFGPQGKANTSLATRNNVFRSFRLYPDAKSYSTTAHELWVKSRTIDAGELGGGAPLPVFPLGSGGVVQLHETVMNNFFDHLGLQGKTFAPRDLTAYLQSQISTLLGRNIVLAPLEEKPGDKNKIQSITFDQHDPVRFRAIGGRLEVAVRASFKLEEDEAPNQRITVPLYFTVLNDSLLIERGGVGVKGGNLGAIGRSAVIKTKIQNLLRDKGIPVRGQAGADEEGKSVPSRRFKREFHATIENRDVISNVTRIDVADGWLNLYLQ